MYGFRDGVLWSFPWMGAGQPHIGPKGEGERYDPPPQDAARGKQEEIGTASAGARKPWAKPTILRILDGVILETGTGPQTQPAASPENPTYTPSS